MSQFLFVGSHNPVKIDATKHAVEHMWADAHVQGYSVSSGVSEQPMSDEETKQGAQQRARSALAAGLAQHAQRCAQAQVVLGVGLEGGVTKIGDELWSTVWVSVVDSIDPHAQVFSSNGARIYIPDVVAKPLLAGEEMGPVVEKLVGDRDVRSKQGFIGVITEDFVDRMTEYSSIAKLSIGLWYGRAWQEKLQK